MPLWMPIAAIISGWYVWQWYTRTKFLAKVNPVLLEVKMPRNLVKSPRAMENALSLLWTDSGETTFLNRVWQGQVRPFFSLEIASFGGEIHFYVWVWKAWRHVVESAIYAYYPEVEIVEAEDYAMKFKYDPAVHEVFATDWRLEPKNDAYQIKTYMDFELEKEIEEEYKIDPFAEVLERMSSIKPMEQMWIQILITMSRDKTHVKGTPWWETTARWNALIHHEIDSIREHSLGDYKEEEWRRYSRMPQPGPAEAILGMDRNLTKHPFNFGARGVYISDSKNFNGPTVTGLRWIWRPMGNQEVGNQLRPRRWGNIFDWPWQDLFDKRWVLHHRRFFDAFRRRSWFYQPWIMPHNMVSTEMIATIWHPPSNAIEAPGLRRIPAKRKEAPPNLPKE